MALQDRPFRPFIVAVLKLLCYFVPHMDKTISNTLPAPGFLIAGLSGGSGKSVVAVGITAVIAEQGLRVTPFKKGPDYIDAGWMQLAAGHPCHNLDPYLMEPETLKKSYIKHSQGFDIAVVEGNRGLFDGVNATGTYSSAELAEILQLPIILVVDCTKTTRTVAALLLGCLQMAGKDMITGVILNRIGSARHEKIIRQSVEHYTDLKVCGAVPRLRYDVFPQRHIGITPCQEYDGARKAVLSLITIINDNCDVQTITSMAKQPSIEAPSSSLYKQCQQKDAKRFAIGIIKDTAFQFYYPENIKALEQCGADIIEINALEAERLPPLDGLYIGGGFPENSAQQLSANTSFRESLKKAIEQGLPVYAECGGLIYLGNSMEVDGKSYPLTDIFPVSFAMEKKPQAHGYTILEATEHNPVYPVNSEIKGHEFRYSKITDWRGDPEELAFIMKRGTGFANGMDGLVYKNVLALYTHIHALGTPEWAKLFMEKVKSNKQLA